MNREEEKDLYVYARNYLVREGTTAHDAVEMRRLAMALRRLNEADCSRYRNDEQEAAAERRRKRLSGKIFELAKKGGFRARLQGDPRGPAVYLDHEEREVPPGERSLFEFPVPDWI